MTRPLSVSVVFPAFNEEENLRAAAGNARSFLSDAVAGYHVVIVNDGSTEHIVDRMIPTSQASAAEHSSSLP